MKCSLNNAKVRKADALITGGSRLLDKSKSGHSDAASARLTKANKLLYEAGCIKKGTLKK